MSKFLKYSTTWGKLGLENSTETLLAVFIISWGWSHRLPAAYDHASDAFCASKKNRIGDGTRLSSCDSNGKLTGY